MNGFNPGTGTGMGSSPNKIAVSASRKNIKRAVKVIKDTVKDRGTGYRKDGSKSKDSTNKPNVIPTEPSILGSEGSPNKIKDKKPKVGESWRAYAIRTKTPSNAYMMSKGGMPGTFPDKHQGKVWDGSKWVKSSAKDRVKETVKTVKNIGGKLMDYLND